MGQLFSKRIRFEDISSDDIIILYVLNISLSVVARLTGMSGLSLALLGHLEQGRARWARVVIDSSQALTCRKVHQHSSREIVAQGQQWTSTMH